MQKKFITNLGFLLFLNLLIKPFWLLGIDRTVQNVTGSEVYGGYFALLNFTFLFNILLDLGITNFNNRNIARNRHLVTKHLSGILTIRMLLAGLYTVVSLLIAIIIGYGDTTLQLLFILIFNQVLISLILYLRSNLAGLHLFRVDSVISVLDRLIMILICAWLLWFRSSSTPFKIEWFVWAQTAAYLVTALIAFLFVRSRVERVALKWHPAFSLMILRKSLPFAILILLMTFYNRVDSVMLERMLDDGPYQAGIYAQAFRLLDASNMVAFLFAGLLLPMFSYMIKKQQDIRNLLHLSFSLIMVPAIMVGWTAWFYSGEIMDLLYRDHADSTLEVFSLLMTGFIAVSATYVFGTLLTANGSLKALNLMALSGMVMNIGLNLVLIPKFQATGAAVASLITQMVTALIQILLCVKIFNLKVDYQRITKLMAYTGLTGMVFYYSSDLPFNWAINLMIAGMTGFLIAFVIKLLNLREMIQWWKEKEI